MSRQSETLPTRGELSRIGDLAPGALEMVHRLYETGRRREVRYQGRDLSQIPYREYLKSEEWQELRRAKLRAVGYECRRCERRGVVLDVHHLTYDRRGHEDLEDLIVLCRDCHQWAHKRGDA